MSAYRAKRWQMPRWSAWSGASQRYMPFLVTVNARCCILRTNISGNPHLLFYRMTEISA